MALHIKKSAGGFNDGCRLLIFVKRCENLGTGP